MGRPRKPTSVQDARGYFRKHPERRRDGEPIVTEALCQPREGLPDDVVKAYRDIAAHAPLGVLTRADSIHVEIAACLLAEMRRDFSNFQAARLGLLHKCLAHMAMTPTSRAALHIPAVKGVNPFSQL